jgi:nitrogen-specific signal transduction histidine kinase
MQPQPLNLNDVIGNLTKMLNRIIGEDISLQCTYGTRLPVVQADVGMMEQVLLNLVVNARDAMPNGGQLLIKTEQTSFDEAYAQSHPEARAGKFICISVSDTGTGIAPEHLARIFEPFYTTKEVGKGTGLGLATVHGIAKQHQGWIRGRHSTRRGHHLQNFPAGRPSARLGSGGPASRTGFARRHRDDSAGGRRSAGPVADPAHPRSLPLPRDRGRLRSGGPGNLALPRGGN